MKSERSPVTIGAEAMTSDHDPLTMQPFVDVLNLILTSIHEPAMVLDPKLQVVKANHAFYQTFQIDPQEKEGITIYMLGNQQWDIPGLRELLEHHLPKNHACERLRNRT